MNDTEVVEVVDDDPEGYMNEDTDDEPQHQQYIKTEWGKLWCKRGRLQ